MPYLTPVGGDLHMARSDGISTFTGITGLVGGGFATATRRQSGVEVTTYDADRNVLKTVLVGGVGGQYEYPDLTALPDGGFVLTFSAVVAQPAGGTEFEIFAQRFRVDGSSLGPTIEVFDDQPGTGSTDFPVIEATLQGFVVAAWGGQGVIWRSFAADGTALGGRHVGGTTTSDIRLGADGDGGVWLSYGSVRQSTIQHLDASGAPVGVGFAPTAGGAAHVVALGNDRILVVTNGFFVDGSNSDDEIMGQLYSDAGVPVGRLFRISAQGGNLPLRPHAEPMADGGAIVVWYENNSNVVHARRIGPDGNLVGAEFTLNDNPDNLVTLSRAASLANGDVVIGWTELLNLPTGSTQRSEYTYLFSELSESMPRIFGSDAAERLTATAPREIIAGLGNDTLAGSTSGDRLRGGDGADTASGSAGNDTLYGGDSEADLRDLLFGGDDLDLIFGGHGNDELHGGNGNDTVLGDFGSDTVIGNDGNDVLSGGAGSDLMFGNAGNDTLNGGFGFDRMNGGAGADSFFHLGVADHASDWIQDYSAAQGDVLTVGLAGATRSQFQINTTTTPGAGAAGVAEAFVIYRPTGQILWALVDGGDDAVINASIGGQVFDLTA